MKSTFGIVILAAVVAAAIPGAPARAATWEYPAVDGYGPVQPIPGAVMKPDPKLEYKVVVDVFSDKSDTNDVNSQLGHVARLLNVFDLGGVKPDRMKVAAVIHSGATPIILSDDAYMERSGKPNPNRRLIQELRDRGVGIYVCGQSLADFHIDPAAVDSNVTITLSSQVAIPTFELQGYAYMP